MTGMLPPWMRWRQGAWALSARLARRETVRRPGRTLLVALLIAIPIAGMVVADAWVRTDHRTEAEKWRVQWGTADAYATTGAAGVESFTALLPAGTATVTYRTEYRLLRTANGRRSRSEVTDLPMTDPMTAHVMQLFKGRVPRQAGEVFLTRKAAKELAVKVGDELVLERPAPMRLNVVGVGERRAWWGGEAAVLGTGTPYPWAAEGASFGPSNTTVLADFPALVPPDDLQRLSTFSGGIAFAPGVVPVGTPGDTVPGADGTGAIAWSWVAGAVALTVLGIVIAAAFAAGARRQLATLGQLAANGAGPPVLRRVLFLQGTWTGMAGTAAGVALGGLALAVLSPHADRLFNRDVRGFTVRPLDLVPVVVLGVAAATLAAMVPSRATARIPVLAALAGRRPLRPVPGWLTTAGLGVSAAGLALLGLAVLGAGGGNGSSTVWPLTAVLGGVAVLLGSCAVAPRVVSVLEPLAGRLRGAPRLAARSLARQRTRTSGVVSAVCATGALAVGTSALLLAAHAHDARQPELQRDDEVQLQATTLPPRPVVPDGWTPGSVPVPDSVVAAVRDVLPDARVDQVPIVHGLLDGGVPAQSQPGKSGALVAAQAVGTSGLAVVVDETVLRLYDVPAAARRALADDGVVLLGPGRGRVAISARRGDGGTERLTPAVVGFGNARMGELPWLLLSPTKVAELGLPIEQGPLVLRSPRPLTADQRNAVEDAVETAREESDGQQSTVVEVRIHYPTSGVDPLLLQAVLAGLALLLSLFVVAVNLALAAAETRDERDLLAVVGAPPTTMMMASGHKAALLTLLGGAMAVPVGFLPVAAFIVAGDDHLPIVFPWRVVVLLVLVIPLVAAAVTVVASGTAIRLRPVRASTMLFE
jgi:putative ABC transport system permease protein